MYAVLFIGAMSYMIMIIFRWWARQKAEIQERRGKFSVEACICLAEGDRQFVYGNIADLMEASDMVRVGCSLQAAFGAFDEVVRRTLPSAFRSKLGQHSFQYKHYVVLAFTIVGPQGCDYWVRTASGESLFVAVVECLPFMFWIFTLWPLCFIGVEVVASALIHLRGWCDLALLSLSLIICLILPGILIRNAPAALVKLAMTSSREAFILTVLLCVDLRVSLLVVKWFGLPQWGGVA
mmetsp:Transcript_86970/g.279090  ORF Transcript_86970/g.279090 Transcript_86970/m.279090 type:complete len:237 (+) Transcript_86970:474-1184(+)